jgi:peptide/nickel transport system substrate-binding protein
MESNHAVESFLKRSLKPTGRGRCDRRRLIRAAAGGAALVAAPLLRGSAATAQSATPVAGGTVRLPLVGTIGSFDPIVPFDNASIWTQLLVYDQLVRLAADGTSLEPGLAESWESSADGLAHTFHLRQAAFHDGTPCTADDVAYSLDRVRADPASTFASLYAAISAVEAPDPATVVVRLTTPWAPLLADLALFAASVIPKAAHQAKQAALFDAPIGTGPFAVASWGGGNDVVLAKHRAYWDAGKPYLDGVTLSDFGDADERLARFRAGELDVAIDVPYDALPGLRVDPSVVVIEDPLAGVHVFCLNTSRPPFDDKALRQAVNYAIDKQKLVDVVLGGAGTVAKTFLPPMPFHEDDAPGYPYDLAKAKELVASSSAPIGFDAEIIVDSTQAGYDQMGDMIAADLAQIGGRITVTGHFDTFVDRWSVGDYDLATIVATTDILDPDELTSAMVVGTGPLQALFTFYDNPEVDDLAARAAAMTDPTERAEAYRRIQTIVNDDAPFVPLFFSNAHAVASSHVKNFRILPTSSCRLWEVWRDDA